MARRVRGRQEDDLDPTKPAYRFALQLRGVTRETGLSKSQFAKEIFGNGKERALDGPSRGDYLPSDEQLTRLLNHDLLSEDQRWHLKMGVKRTKIGLKQPREEPPRPYPVLDLVGVGALNYDYIVPTSQVSSLIADRTLAATRYSSLPERRLATQAEFDALLLSVRDRLTASGMEPALPVLGGSSFNVVRLLSATGLYCKTGYVGVGGAAPEGSGLLSHRDHLLEPGRSCDATFLKTADGEVGGCCVSEVHPKGDYEVQRHLSTWPGANTQLYGYLVDNFWSILDYLSAARMIHVTSLFDDNSPDVLADILEYVIEHSPLVRVSFDPGHEWATRHREAVSRILRVSSLLFVNEKELDGLCQTYCRYPEEPDEASTAREILRGMRKDAALIVVKHLGATSIYCDGSEPLRDEIAKVEQVEDDTGAGDYFAASVLASQLSSPLSCRFGVVAGMHLARHKLGYVGPPPDNALPDLLRSLPVGRQDTGRADWSNATELAEKLLPLRLLLVGGDQEALKRLESAVAPYGAINTVRFDNVTSVSEEFRGASRIDGVFIDIISLGAHEGTGLIALGREERPEVGFVLYGSGSELHGLPGVSDTWRTVLEKYWTLRKDIHPHAFSARVEDNLILLLLYRLSEGRFGKEPGEVARIVMQPGVAGILREVLRNGGDTRPTALS